MTNPTAPLLTESDGLLVKARDMLTYLKERGLGEPILVRDLCDELERKQTENAALREQLAENARNHFDDARDLETRLAQAIRERDEARRQRRELSGDMLGGL